MLGQLLTGLSRRCPSPARRPAPSSSAPRRRHRRRDSLLGTTEDIVITTHDAKIGSPSSAWESAPPSTPPSSAWPSGMVPAAPAPSIPASSMDAGAVAIGLAHESLATPAECEARTLAIADELAAKPRHAMAYTKHWLNGIDGSNHNASSKRPSPHPCRSWVAMKNANASPNCGPSPCSSHAIHQHHELLPPHPSALLQTSPSHRRTTHAPRHPHLQRPHRHPGPEPPRCSQRPLPRSSGDCTPASARSPPEQTSPCSS